MKRDFLYGLQEIRELLEFSKLKETFEPMKNPALQEVIKLTDFSIVLEKSGFAEFPEIQEALKLVDFPAMQESIQRMEPKAIQEIVQRIIPPSVEAALARVYGWYGGADESSASDVEGLDKIFCTPEKSEELAALFCDTVAKSAEYIDSKNKDSHKFRWFSVKRKLKQCLSMQNLLGMLGILTPILISILSGQQTERMIEQGDVQIAQEAVAIEQREELIELEKKHLAIEQSEDSASTITFQLTNCIVVISQELEPYLEGIHDGVEEAATGVDNSNHEEGNA